MTLSPARACRRSRACGLVLALVLAGCRSTGDDLLGLAEHPPLDYAVLVSGGAFLEPGAVGGQTGPLARTFGSTQGTDEPIGMDRIVDVLRRGRVFHRVGAHSDPVERRALVTRLGDRDGASSDQVLRFLEGAREEGYDLLVLLEQLEDGPVAEQGINGQWPLTLSLWLLVGLGMFIPDHSFESTATLRFSVRDLQTGRVLHEQLLPAGPVDLSLVERSNVLGMAVSIVVPPFWVHNDDQNVLAGVREFSARRLLLSLARELKSQSTRLRLRERAVAAIDAAPRDGGLQVRVESPESLSIVRLRVDGEGLPEPEASRCQRLLVGSMQREGRRFVYDALLPVEPRGELLQVLVRTIGGNVASTTVRL